MTIFIWHRRIYYDYIYLAQTNIFFVPAVSALGSGIVIVIVVGRHSVGCDFYVLGLMMICHQCTTEFLICHLGTRFIELVTFQAIVPKVVAPLSKCGWNVIVHMIGLPVELSTNDRFE